MDADLTIDHLLRDHADFARRLARSLLRDDGAAEDVSQEAWRVVLERRSTAAGDFRSWLGGVVRNLARMHLRSEAARRRRELKREYARIAAHAASETAPDAAAQRINELELLLAALKRLREPFRTAIVLRYEHGLAPREIARRTGEPLATVKSRLKRGLAMLRADLASAHGGDDRAWRLGLAPLLWRPTARRTTALAALGSVAAVVTGAVLWQPAGARPDLGPAADLAAQAAPAIVPAAPISAVRVPVRGNATGATAACERVLRLVDARTSEPIPEFLVAAPALDPPMLVTDTHGRLTLAYAGDQPSIELQLIDDARLPRIDAPDPALDDDELRVAIGPTYRLDLEPPPGVADRLEARLVALDARHAHRTSFAPVRGGDEPWARFAADALELGGGPPWRLEVRSDDGFGLGHAVVDSVVGIQRDAVRIVLDPTGRVEGRVCTDDGTPVDQAQLELMSHTGTTSFVTTSDARGQFELAWIPPGSYALRARSRLHTATERAVVVQAARASEITLQLAARARGDIAGKLRSASGHARHAEPQTVTIVLTARDDPDSTFLQTLAAPFASGDVAAFRFAGIPAGDYELTVRASDFARFRPATLRVTPPRADIELVRADTEPAADVVLTAIDAGDGRPLERFEVFARLDGEAGSGKVLATEDGRLRLRNVPHDASLEFTLRAEGYAALDGNREATAGPLRLRRGWANTVRCLDGAGKPVAGVRLIAGREPTSPSAADGSVRITRRARPERLALAPGRWQLTGGDVFADGDYRDLLWGITVIVAPLGPNPDRPHHEKPRHENPDHENPDEERK